ncbi:hypothetical protein ACIA8G_41990 [Lentzea sp. NPDC051213]|uniref:hypothetical protein n=1 Tax=Lentzea sp. NPDC051213 TaxID=3364126 RepID=UPI0037975307
MQRWWISAAKRNVTLRVVLMQVSTELHLPAGHAGWWAAHHTGWRKSRWRRRGFWKGDRHGQ